MRSIRNPVTTVFRSSPRHPEFAAFTIGVLGKPGGKPGRLLPIMRPVPIVRLNQDRSNSFLEDILPLDRRNVMGWNHGWLLRVWPYPPERTGFRCQMTLAGRPSRAGALANAHLELLASCFQRIMPTPHATMEDTHELQ